MITSFLATVDSIKIFKAIELFSYLKRYLSGKIYFNEIYNNRKLSL